MCARVRDESAGVDLVAGEVTAGKIPLVNVGVPVVTHGCIVPWTCPCVSVAVAGCGRVRKGFGAVNVLFFSKKILFYTDSYKTHS